MPTYPYSSSFGTNIANSATGCLALPTPTPCVRCLLWGPRRSIALRNYYKKHITHITQQVAFDRVRPLPPLHLHSYD